MILIIPIKDSLSIRIYRCTDKIAIGVAVFIVRSAVRKVLLTVGIIDNRFRSVSDRRSLIRGGLGQIWSPGEYRIHGERLT